MAYSRSLRLPHALLALSVIAMTPFHAPLAHAQAAKKAPAKDPFRDGIAEAEKLFAEGKIAPAAVKFQEIYDKFKDRMDDQQKAAFVIQIATCHFRTKKWAEAEASLREFLTKYPGGVSNADDPGNQRDVAQLSLAEALVKQEKFDDAIKSLAEFYLNDKNSDQHRIRARIFAATVMEMKVAKGKPEEKKAAAQRALDLLLKAGYLNADFAVPEYREAAYKIVELYTKLGMNAEAAKLQAELEQKITNPSQLVRASFLKMDLGDRYFQQAEELQASNDPADVAKREGLYKSAIANFQGVQRRAYIATFMDKALEQADAVLEAAKTAAAGVKPVEVKDGQPPPPPNPLLAAVAKAQADKDSLVEIKKSFEANKSYDSVIAYRLGLCLTELKRPFEALVAFKEIIDKDPEFEVGGEKKGDIAHYYYIVSLDAIRDKRAQDECKKFLAKHEKSAVVGQVAVMLGEISMRREDYREAIRHFRWARDPKNVPGLSPQDAEYIDATVIDCYFRNIDWPEAQKAAEHFLNTYPRSTHKELIQYMRALTFFYQTKFADTTAAFDKYEQDYPNGQYLADVRYRKALVILGLIPQDANENVRREKLTKNALEVVNRCQKWLEQYKDTVQPNIINQRPEVMTLLADAHQKIADFKLRPGFEKADKELKLKHAELAVNAYVNAALNAGDNKQTLDFLLRELNKTLPARGEWSRLREIYQKLYERDKKAPDALGHLYWVIKCTERMGKTPEEKLKASEEAKGILAAAVVDNINDVRQDSVEMLIMELAQKLSREVKKREKANKDKPGSVEPLDADATLESLLKLKENKDSLIAQARGEFAKAEISRHLNRPDDVATRLEGIARRFKPDELSPTILAAVGDHLLKTGKDKQALPLFTYLKENHRGSQFADFGFYGVAEILIKGKDYKKALTVVEDALDNQIANSRERDLTFQRARLFMELGRHKEANDAFLSIIKTKEWKGEAHAGAYYYLGLNEERQGKFNEALNYYQRCYLSWKSVPKYYALASLGATRLLAEKKSDRAGALKTLNDTFFKLENPKLLPQLKNLPEWAEAEALRDRVQ